MKDMLNDLKEIITPVTISALGGCARIMDSYLKKEKISICRAGAELVMAIFAGLLVHWMTLDSQLSEGWRTASISLAGYSSRSIINLLNDLLLRRMRGTGK